MALYVWYEGKDLKERYGITKQTLKTDEDVDDSVFDVVDDTVDITDDINDMQNEMLTDGKDQENNDAQNKAFQKAKHDIGISYDKWDKSEIEKEKHFLTELLRSHPDALKAYAYKYHMSK